MSAMAGWPYSSRSGRLATRVRNPSRAISATSSIAICGATEMLSSIFLISTRVSQRRSFNPLDHFECHHTGHHGRNKDHGLDFSGTKRHQGGPGTKTGDAPADSEHHAANNKSGLNTIVGGHFHRESKE